MTPGTAVAVPAAGRGVPPRLQRAVAGVLLPAATVAVAVTGLRVSAPGGITASFAVAAGLVIAWAAAAAAWAWAPWRAAAWQLALGGLAGAVVLAAARAAAGTAGGGHTAARAAATIAGPLMIAISFHFLLAFPGGLLRGRPRQACAGLAYAAALAAGLGLAAAGRPVPAAAASAAWAVLGLAALPPLRLRYQQATGSGCSGPAWGRWSRRPSRS